MNYLSTEIQNLDANIIEQLPKDCGISRWAVKQHGLCEHKFNQNENAVLLHDSDFNKVTIDDSFDMQLIHVHNGVNGAIDEQYGDFVDTSYKYGMKLIVLTTKKTIIERVLQAFVKSESTVFLRMQSDTEQILKNELKIKVGLDKNYPPEYKALLFFYDFASIEPEIYDEL